ncbi:GRIP1-associated protein 1-like isoform X2 [Mya arenaria]|uniref:GRIP1-associated protein 1-like isoform X2 n=1 Tax=Mya arenaria TaxID=6604 RepID=UPI0022E047E4|nr:GRIP1-associated protein 1-like isoform X2 [Mya arenaria]
MYVFQVWSGECSAVIQYTKEEEQQIFRDENGCSHMTAFINMTNRMEEEIDALKKEKMQLFDQIQGQKDDLLRAKRNKTDMKNEIEKLQKECTELRTTRDVFHNTLAAKLDELREKEEKLKMLRKNIENKKRDLRNSKEDYSKLNEHLEKELKLQTQIFHRLTEQLSELQKELQSSTMRLSEKEEEIQRLTEELLDKEREIFRFKVECLKKELELERSMLKKRPRQKKLRKRSQDKQAEMAE